MFFRLRLSEEILLFAVHRWLQLAQVIVKLKKGRELYDLELALSTNI